MRIAQITYTGFGGLGSVVFSLIESPLSKPIEWAIAFIGIEPVEKSYVNRCAALNIAYGEFQTSANRRYNSWKNLLLWLISNKPDAIICHSITSILPCKIYSAVSRAPLIAVEHTANQIKSRNEIIASKLAMLCCDHVIVLTDQYREELQILNGFFYRKKKVSVIPNGINFNIFAPNSLSPIAGKKLIKIGMSGRFSFSKRQDILIRSLKIMRQLRPHINFQLCFAGDGENKKRVYDLVAENDISNCVRFDGLLHELDVADWLRELDIYAHATDAETFSTSILQAMATGLPIVASDFQSIKNLLGANSEYGRCVPNEPQDFAEAIISYIDNPRIAKSIGERARKLIHDEYGHEKMLSRYLQVIKSSFPR